MQKKGMPFFPRGKCGSAETSDIYARAANIAWWIRRRYRRKCGGGEGGKKKGRKMREMMFQYCALGGSGEIT